MIEDSAPYTRLFTLEEAQGLLLEIEPLVGQMKSAFKRIRREIADASKATGLQPSNPRLSEHLEQRGVANALVSEVNGLIRRIHEHGCVVNGPEAGLIDFPALFDSEIVFLCWKHGEPRIEHWHRIPDGFANRKPLLDPEGARSDQDSAIVH